MTLHTFLYFPSRFITCAFPLRGVGEGTTSNLSGFVTQVSSLFFRFPFSRAHPRGQIPWGWERPVEVQFDGDDGSYVRNVSHDEGDNVDADSPLSWHGGPPYAPRCY